MFDLVNGFYKLDPDIILLKMEVNVRSNLLQHGHAHELRRNIKDA